MTCVLPFRGFRYDPARVGPLEKVVTQPYDKISEQMLQAYRRHPYNIAHVIRNPDYREAGEHLNRWIREGILRQDEQPFFYLYQQVFRWQGETLSRLGVIALLDLEVSAGRVRGHERILDAPLEDRLALIRHTEANEGLIFMLHPPLPRLRSRLEETVRDQPPACRVEDEYGVRHRLWLLGERALQEQVARQLSELPLYIADGHHRFETSRRFYQECRQRGWLPQGTESFDKRMVALFDMADPGVKIFPTHRGVKNLSAFRPQQFLRSLEEFFQIHPLGNFEQLLERLARTPGCLGCVLRFPHGGLEYRLLRVREEAWSDPGWMPEVQGSARQLDVNILHEGILAPLLGIGEGELAGQKFVDYYREAEELWKGIARGAYQLAFFLRPTPLEMVRILSDEGRKMPQKSTDFYPKLLTGLVLMKMGIRKNEQGE